MSSPEEARALLARYFIALTVSNNLEQARKRMRNAWIAGFIWMSLSFMGAAVGVWSLETGEGPGLGPFILIILEVGLIAYLSYGVLQRRRGPATALFFYFWISRIPWIAAGLIGLQAGPDVARFLLLQVLPAYLFFQGMRGAWTYHYLTHPQYPRIPTAPEDAEFENRSGK
jgi:hypothetical protein